MSPITGEVIDIGPWTQSKINCARGCPHKFREKYYNKRRVELPDDSLANLGSQIHKAIEVTLRAWADGKRAVPPPLSVEGQEVFTKWLEVFKAEFAADDIHLIEEDVRFEIAGRKCQCILDYVSISPSLSTAWIYDWKTGWKIMSDEAVKHDIQMQMEFCAIAQHPLIQEHGITNFQVGPYYVRRNARKHHEWSIDDHGLVKRSVARIIQMMEEAEDYPATPGDACDYCELWSSCPAIEKLGKGAPRVPRDEAQARKMAEDIVLHEKAAAERKRLLGLWLDKQQSLTHNGLVWQHGVSARRTVDTAAAIERFGLAAVMDYLKVDGSAMEKKAADLYNLLKESGCAKESLSSRFACTKEKS